MARLSDDLDWTDAGPRSRRFNDIYFSAIDGLAETRAVFLEGCGLPDAWEGRPAFVVAELGFGTGLNIAAVLDLWRRTRPPGGRLSLFSVETFPLTRAEAARALGAWPELGAAAAALLAAWPDGRRGFHRLDFPDIDAALDLWVGEAAEGLNAWSGAADAWFLDGFAPARNPQMWRDEVLALVAARSVPSARLATFTVAGAVRRGLEAAGFTVEKHPGFGAKRERLEARLSSSLTPCCNAAPERVAIVGAGIAGASLARALRRLGCTPTVVEAVGPGAGASGNPAALVTPRLDAGLGLVARLHAQGFARAVALYDREAPDAIVARGALQLESAPKDAARFDRLAAWDGFALGALIRLSRDQAAERLDEPAPGGLAYTDAMVVEPALVLESWLRGVDSVCGQVAAIERAGTAWRLLDEDGGLVVEAGAIVLAAGPTTAPLATALAAILPLQPVRGQASWTAAVNSGPAAAWGGYAIPLRGGGVLFGATHGRGDWDVEPRVEDDARNLDLLAQGRPVLADKVRAAAVSTPLRARASLRAATPDHLPLAGRLAEGAYTLSGLGARGFGLAPMLAEHVAALIIGAPSPLPRDVAAAISPARYLVD